MEWITLLSVLIVAQPTAEWVEHAREEFKLPSLEVIVDEEGVTLEVESLSALDAETHDHLLASFFAVLGQDKLSSSLSRVVVRDRSLAVWKHPEVDFNALRSARETAGSDAGVSLERVRYRNGVLSDVHLGLSAGHGIMWDDGVWRYQRSELYELREDLHTNHIMSGLIVPMLERMGATLTLVRGAGFDATRVQLDNSSGAFSENGSWAAGSSPGGWESDYRVLSVDSTESGVAIWSWVPESSGEFPVYMWYVAGTNRNPRTLVRVKSGESLETLYLDQTKRGSRWVYLGSFPFEKGRTASVEVSNLGDDSTRYVVADAIWVGGGTGTVDFGGGSSGKVFWQQSAQAQSREFALPSAVSNPYGDVTVRPAWAIWEDVDLYISLHTNAGGGRGTSTFVYSNQVAYPSFDPNRAESLQPGSLELQDAIHDRMIESIRRYWDPGWRDRGKWGANFGELRPLTLAWREDASISIPAMLIELAFHDSEDDTYYLREQRFRYDMARAIVRGIVDFVYRNEDASPPLPPEPPVDLSISGTATQRVLQWNPQSDPIDPNSTALSYRVEVSSDGKAFFPYITTAENSIVMDRAEACVGKAWRVVALNESGESLASEPVIDIPVYPSGRRILWIDGHRRWVQTVNESPRRPQPSERMLSPLSTWASGGIGVDSAHAAVVAGGALELDGYDVVIWSAGETSTVDQSLTGAERQALEDYLESGGTVVLSGSEIAWHLGRSFDESEQAFFEEVLGASYVADSSSSYELSWLGVIGEETESMNLDDGTGNYQRVGYPDVIESLVNGTVIAQYGSSDEAAGLWQPALNGNLFYLAFPLEAVRQESDRVRILEDIVTSVAALADHSGSGCLEDGSEPEEPDTPDAPIVDSDQLRQLDLSSASLSLAAAPEPVEPNDGELDSEGCAGCQGTGNSFLWPMVFFAWWARRCYRRYDLSQA